MPHLNLLSFMDAREKKRTEERGSERVRGKGRKET